MDLCALYQFEPDIIACDLHPDYYSTQWARTTGKPVVAIQHHHAHAAACAAENDLREPYLAVVWDGTGYGLDQTIWGGEFFAVPDPGPQTRYEALRAYLLDGEPAAAVAERFGYTTAGLHSAVADFRAGAKSFFLDARPGPKTAPGKDAARTRICWIAQSR